MLKSNAFKKACQFLAIGVLFIAQSCGGKKGSGLEGEVTGVPDREGWVQTVPYGMVVCPSGTFHMGQADQDVPATYVNMNKQVNTDNS